MCYLVLPQTQGAKVLYQQYVDPFLAQHEREIEEFIVNSHERAKTMGLQYFYQAIDLIREKVLGLPAQSAAAPPQAAGPAAYAQSFLSRFNIPTGTGAAPSQAPATNDWYSTLTSAVASMASAGKSHEDRANELSASGNLFPREMASMSPSEKQKFITNQRDMLEVLRTALAKEESNLGNHGETEDHLAYGGIPLKKNRSENSFDHIEHEDTRTPGNQGSSGWGLFGQQAGSSGVDFAAKAVDELTRSRGQGQS